MCALGKPDARGQYQFDPNEPPFSEDELDAAYQLRKKVRPDVKQKRRDHCPHTPMCTSLAECLENIAWFLRYQRELNAPERAEIIARKRALT